MVLHPQKFCMKFHKSKYKNLNFHTIFCLTKYYQNQNLQLWLCHQHNNTYHIQYQFLLMYHYSQVL